jgi:hypothetical protein
VRPVEDELLPVEDPEEVTALPVPLPVEVDDVLARGVRDDSVPLEVEPLRV